MKSFDNFPDEFADLRICLLWKRIYKDGKAKPSKMPYYANGKLRSGAHGSAEDRAQLVTFEEAKAAFLRGGFDGIGLAMLSGLGIVALDFDNCVTGTDADRVTRPDVEALCEGTYTEFSPSRTGIRAFMLGSLPSKKDAHGEKGPFGVEFFGDSGYVTYTGDVTPGCALFGCENTVLPVTPEVLALYTQRFGAPVGGAGTARSENDAWLLSVGSRMGLSNDQCRELLFQGDPGRGYPEWLHDLMALHHETHGSDAGLNLAIEWSSGGKNYAGPKDVCSHWRSFGRDRGKAITIKRLVSQAAKISPEVAKLAYMVLVDTTDTGNSNLMQQLTAGNLIHSPEPNCFYHWDGEKWSKDESRTIAQREALRVGEQYLNEARELKQKATGPEFTIEDQKRLVKIADSVEGFGKSCRNKRALDAMLALFARDFRVSVSATKFDRAPYLLGVENGVVDLRTGELRQSARDEFVTKRAPVNYFKDAKAPKFEKFVLEVTGLPIAAQKDSISGAILPATVGRYTPRPALALYIQKALGYSITGETREHKMFIAVGAGGNGKNVLLDIVQGVAGENWQTIPPEALMATRGESNSESPSPTIASLAGARAGISSESRDGQKLDVAIVKRHTGGGTMTGRFMRENNITFDITHKLWLMTNHLPALDHLDEALRGRIHLIPFDRRWNRPGHTQWNPGLPDGDKHLMDALKAEYEGILAWLVQGAVKYYAEGLEPPAAVTAMTRGYFDDADAMGQWLETCEPCTPDKGMRTSELFTAFNSWCFSNECKDDRTLKSFSDALKSRGFEKVKKNDGNYFAVRPNSAARASQQEVTDLFN